MAYITRSNIAYDLSISPHKLKVGYDDFEITYIFSSELYKNKFIEKLGCNRDKINSSLSNRFGIEIVNNILCDLKLYTTIEKRGFLIYKGEEEISCVSNIKLNGTITMISS